ncbi:hypothetical protein AKG07_03505 [Microbacterium sp. CGR1]|uniref:DUF6993 domain-containing protein n=1 Tax=Microbacterium sp. CGR1 TaxID=1696072 RepID=UPI0006A2AD9B|nr:hypothetical protein [Microbacterium sp. CGR1]AKV85509.1 hypothetical protein AKG07_03505 [Microbacterium sp. CGR1]
MLRRPDSSAPRSAIAVGIGTTLVLLLTACGPTASPAPALGPTDAAASPGPSASPAGPVFVADGSAEDNLPLFAAVTDGVWASEQRVSGRAYIDALTAAGFDKAAMQVTADVTTVGNPVESLQFAVRWGDAECLVGQVGPSTGEPVAVVMPQLAEGRCLVGATRAIDW